MRQLFYLSFLIVVACATLKPKPTVDFNNSLQLQLPAPLEVTVPLRAIQVLSLRHSEHTKTFQIIFENYKNKMVLAVLTPLWPTPLKAQYNGQEIEVDRILKSSVPFDFRFILGDIILVQSPSHLLKKWLSAGSNVIDTKGRREITYFAKGLEHKFMQIDYESEDHWQGKILIKNYERNYEIEIKTLHVDYL